MPVRLLRPGLTTSLRWNSVDWIAQSFYVRLLTLVDDYGRYDANLNVLKAYTFPLRPEVTVDTVFSACKQLMEAGLISFYVDWEQKPYIQMLKWIEKARSMSRFPDPNDPRCKQLQTIACKCLLPTPSPSPSPSPSSVPPNGGVECDLLGVKLDSKPTPNPTCPEHQGQQLATPDDIYAAYPRHIARKDALRAITKACAAKCQNCLLDLTRKFAQAKAGSDLNFVPHPATWFNRESYLDDPAEWIRKPQPPQPVADRKAGMLTGERPHD